MQRDEVSEEHEPTLASQVQGNKIPRNIDNCHRENTYECILRILVRHHRDCFFYQTLHGELQVHQ